MAEALIARAEYKRSQIGDHGDPYEESLLSGIVTLELKIIVKEILEHLRSVLDYSAREVVETISKTPSSHVYFPIVSKIFKQEDFKSRVGKSLPGILNYRPDLLPVFESFQPFIDKENNWLADFATICNENKHEQLSIIKRDSADFKTLHKNGGNYLSITTPDGSSPFRKMPLLLMDTDNSKVLFILIEEIDEELLGFLDCCINGVNNIIQKLKRVL
ncbi:hypothetical protein [Bacillus pseudomycoides]|uniref:hypothetical protein n=1 Tax=Bacillus pseudomycoides TaxID=64104 RepID=UPI000BF70D09|nr:hypothetical protein [Bacillus pseudomycoides]PEP56247.1 hypothetical protein CN564_18090 [Bacillus pseudomycoides]